MYAKTQISLTLLLVLSSSQLGLHAEGPSAVGGSLNQQYSIADVVLAGTPQVDEESCMDTTFRGLAAKTCRAHISPDRTYKGTLSGPSLEIRFIRRPNERFAQENVLTTGKRVLLFLCNTGGTLEPCTQTLAMTILTAPGLSTAQSSASGLALMADDAAAGLVTADAHASEINLLYLLALNDRRHLTELKHFRETAPLNLKLLADSLLIRNSSVKEAKQDLQELATRSDYRNFPNASVLFAEVGHFDGSEFADTLDLLSHSPRPDARRAALQVASKVPSATANPVLATLIDDPTPDISFQALTLLEAKNSHKSTNRPNSFAEFNENADKRQIYKSEWKQWLAGASSR